MKRLIFILFLFCSLFSNARSLCPTDTSFHVISAYTLKYSTLDTTISVTMGAKYGTLKLASFKQLKHKIDSLALIGYTRFYIDSAFLAKHDTIDLVGTKTDLRAKIDTSTRGQANGVATLNYDGKIPASQLSGSLMGAVVYISAWSPATNTPTLPTAASGNKGNYYICSDSATYLGVHYKNKDWVVSNGTSWDKITNTNDVASVFGRIGAILPLSGDYNTSQVTEGTNKYYTDTRARAALSLTTSGKENSYNSTTGVINIAVPDSMTVFSYEYEIESNGANTKVMPFMIRDKTKVFYNGSTLNSSRWSGTYSNTLALNIPTYQADQVSVLSIGKWTVSTYQLWQYDSYGNLTTNPDGVTDSVWQIDSHGNVTPIPTGIINDFWKTDEWGNLTPA
jgi:hypothetical protein